MKTVRLIVAGAAVLALTSAALPAAAQHYDRRYERRDNGDAVAGLVVGAVIGGIAGAVIGDGDDRYVAGGALAGAALGAAAASDRSYRSYGGGYRQDCDYWRDGRCWRNRGHWEREHGINSRDGYDRYERGVMRDHRRDWRSDRRDDQRDDWRDRRNDRRDDRRWRNY